MNVNYNRAIQFCVLSLFCFLYSQATGNLFAQQYYKTLKQGEYKTIEEDTHFNPGARINGSYEFLSTDRKEDFVTGASLGGKFYQDISLEFHSRINTNVSLNVKLGHQSPVVSEQDRAYETQNSAEAPANESGDGFNVRFDEAYLEYNHNPNAQLRIGRQQITIGDRKGLIFEGEANAISQGCRIGTWCYAIGGARIGEEGSASVIWAQLDYPVFESGVVISDPWGDKPTRQESSFSVEIFRVMHGGNNIPLAEYGGWTGEYSESHDTSDDTATGDPVYFDNDDVEYIGLNIIWNYYDFDLHFTWSNMNGSREYFSEDQTTKQGVSLGTKSVSGNAYLLDAGYRLTDEWKSTIRIFNASGNDAGSDSEKIWQKNSKAYFEVQKGSFGDALIYFNGKNGVGDGHSVANLSFYALKFGYREKESTISADLDIYSFSRTKAVLVNAKGAEESEGKNIGLEVDLRVEWRFEERLFFQCFAAYFQAEEAYSTTDSVRPDSDEPRFSLLGIGGRYTF